MPLNLRTDQHDRMQDDRVEYAADLGYRIPHTWIGIKTAAGKALRENLQITQGALFQRRFLVEDAMSGTPYDLRNWIIRADIRDGAGSTLIGQFREGEAVPGVGGGIVLNHYEDAYFDLYATAANTALLDFDSADWDLTLSLVTVGTEIGPEASVAINASAGTVTKTGAFTDTAVYGAGKFIRLAECENAGNNGTYKILSRTDDALTLVGPVGWGSGTTNADDDTVKIQPLTVSTTNVFVLMSGRVDLVKAITE